jgi:hypothetical protein
MRFDDVDAMALDDLALTTCDLHCDLRCLGSQQKWKKNLRLLKHSEPPATGLIL